MRRNRRALAGGDSQEGTAVAVSQFAVGYFDIDAPSQQTSYRFTFLLITELAVILCFPFTAREATGQPERDSGLAPPPLGFRPALVLPDQGHQRPHHGTPRR